MSCWLLLFFSVQRVSTHFLLSFQFLFSFRQPGFGSILYVVITKFSQGVGSKQFLWISLDFLCLDPTLFISLFIRLVPNLFLVLKKPEPWISKVLFAASNPRTATNYLSGLTFSKLSQKNTPAPSTSYSSKAINKACRTNSPLHLLSLNIFLYFPFYFQKSDPPNPLLPPHFFEYLHWAT